MEEYHIDGSSVIRKIAYDRKNSTLLITFNNGATYIYSSFPLIMWQNFKNASSKGQYFARHIKGKFNAN